MENKMETADIRQLGDPFRWADQFAARYAAGTDGDEKLPGRWHYENGCFLKAIEGCYRATGDERYFEYIRGTMDRFIAADGSIAGYLLEEYNLDQINQGKLLFLLAERTQDERYKAAIERLVDQLRSHPRTDEGGFWHKKVYPFQMWLDGLYMAAPFMAQYAAWSGEQTWYDEAAFQLELIEAKARLPRTGLLAHGWDAALEQRWADPATGRSPHVWSRAMGWYAMALADVLALLPVAHPRRGRLAGLFERLMHALAAVQHEATGLWAQVTDQAGREGNYLESSGTAMFAYAFAKGRRLGFLTARAAASASRAYEGLLRHLVAEDGSGRLTLAKCNRVAGLGGEPYRDGSFEYYVSEAVGDNDPKAVSPFIMAGLELRALQASKEENH